MNPSNNISGQSICRFADIEILRYSVPTFEALSLSDKLLIYHLSEAALWGRDIITDQNGAYNLRLRHLLESLYLHGPEQEGEDYLALREYLYRLWFASGVHHHYAETKFVPKFGIDYLRSGIAYIQSERLGLLWLSDEEQQELERVLFDPQVAPRRCVQSGAQDLFTASGVNYYEQGITQQEVEHYYQSQLTELPEGQPHSPLSQGLNTRLRRLEDGTLHEDSYCLRGLYGEALEHICQHLEAAQGYAQSSGQRIAIGHLIRYYQTGDLSAYNDYCIAWVQDTTPSVDFINGFTEVYTDPLGQKGSWEGLVHIRDTEASQRTALICREAGWFEQHAPIDERFKKTHPRGVTATVVQVATIGGDAYPATPLGINLPNADWIRAEHGSKSVTISNIHEAYHRASRGNGMTEAFVPDPSVRALLEKYEDYTEQLHTDLHECLGHGSGQLLPGVSPEALGAYHSVLEEARADLFALYYMADPKLIEMGLLPDAEAYKACYYRYLLNGLVTQLVRLEEGEQLEEAHMRNRALIARYILECSHSSRAVELHGIELVVRDYTEIRKHIAQLLSEVQRIKSEGDYTAGKQLVEQYAIAVDPQLHTAVLSRYKTLGVAPYKGFVNPRYHLVYEGQMLKDITISYDEGYEEQMLRYSRDYSALPLVPIDTARLLDPALSAGNTEVVRSLRESLRLSMDGMVASSMRNKGLHYGINFGLTLDYLQRLASKLPHSPEVASYLLSRDVRELLLLGLMIYPTEQLSYTTAYTLALRHSSNPELRDYMTRFLLDTAPYTSQWALSWVLDPGQSQDMLTLAYTALARAAMHGSYPTSPHARERLLAGAFAHLSAMSDGTQITLLARAILLALKHYAQVDTIAKDIVLTSLSSLGWSHSSNALLVEFAQDLTFALTEC